MFDVMREMINRLERQAEQLGVERTLREIAENKANRQAGLGSDVVVLIEHIANRRLIDAIKLHRQMTGYGLKESKDAIERITLQFKPQSDAA